MPEVEEIRKEVFKLCNALAGITPLVTEVHGQMPRIAEALETLAMITAKLENNTEDHKRIHYRITEIGTTVKTLSDSYDAWKECHLVCMTTKQVERRVERLSWWTRAKTKAGDKVVEIVTLAIVSFVGWMVISHLKEYPKTAPYLNRPAVEQKGSKG
jgi:hypothetical protein